MSKTDQRICIWLSKKDRMLLNLIRARLSTRQSAAVRACIQTTAIQMNLLKMEDILEEAKNIAME